MLPDFHYTKIPELSQIPLGISFFLILTNLYRVLLCTLIKTSSRIFPNFFPENFRKNWNCSTNFSRDIFQDFPRESLDDVLGNFPRICKRRVIISEIYLGIVPGTSTGISPGNSLRNFSKIIPAISPET